MRILLRNLKTGKLSLEETPLPQLDSQGVIVQTHYSLISAGTERAQVQMDKRSLLGKARARPDLVRQVLQKVRSDGIANTFKAVMTRLGTPMPIGYSSAGVVLEAGEMVPGLRVGDTVACYAGHGEAAFVPRNLAVPIPTGLDARIGATASVGAIALQGVRQSGAKLGETVAVIGLGLIGQMTCQLLKAAGCRVIGIDTDTRALEFTARHTPDAMLLPPGDGVAARIGEITSGVGVDAAIICAATKSSAPIELSAEITREQGVVSAVGLVNLDVPREAFYHKELKLLISRSLGPGRYDPGYEDHGLDYPIAYVRWTEGRNMAAWLELAASGAIDPVASITHEFEFGQALDAYEKITGESDDYYLGIMLRYDADKKLDRRPVALPEKKSAPREASAIGAIGVGSYASKFILPFLGTANLRGVASGQGHTAASAGKRFGFAFAAGDPEQVIDDEQTDAVIIATRHDLHASLAAKALAAGKAVFVEKPLCLTIDELRRINEAAGEDCFLHVGFNRRFAPSIRLVKEFMRDSGPAMITCRVNAGPLHGHWLQDIAQGGGRIIGEGCHFIDLLRFLAGSPITRVTSTPVSKPGVSAIECEDVAINLEFEDGSAGSIVYTGSGSKAMTKERYELFGANRCAVLDDFSAVELYGGDQKTKRMRRDTGQQEQMRVFLAGLATGEAPIPYGELIEVTLATLAAVESLARSAPVEMAEMWSLLEAGE